VGNIHARGRWGRFIQLARGGDRFGASFQWGVPAIKSLAPAELLQGGEKLLTLHAPAMLPGVHDDQISHQTLLLIGSLAISDGVDTAHQRLRFQPRLRQHVFATGYRAGWGAILDSFADHSERDV